jgi:hypothetical protein
MDLSDVQREQKMKWGKTRLDRRKCLHFCGILPRTRL